MTDRWRVRPWMLVSAAWTGPAVLAVIDSLAQSKLAGQPPPPASQLLFGSLDWLMYGLFAPLIFSISKRWPLSRPHLVSHGLVHLTVSLVICGAWASGGTVLKMVLGVDSFDGGVGRSLASWFFTTLPFGVGVYLGMVGIEHAIRYFVEARSREAEVARLSEQLIGARLAALQAQLNPHFLFNSLNTIAVLVRDGNAPAATRVVEQLSEVLRRTLSHAPSNEVPLREELELVRQYLAVEEARFSDRLRPSIEIDAALGSAAVPSFALQHLVENAIRHGIAHRTESGVVSVTARRDGETLELTVADDGAGIGRATAATAGHGLENTRERLRTLYGSHASLVVEPAPIQGTVARLRIPYQEISASRNAFADS